MLDCGELGVYPHTFPSNPTRCISHLLRTVASLRFAIHPLQGASNIFGTRNSESASAAIAGFQQVL